MECLRTSAYSTAGDVVTLTDSSIKSTERLRRSGGSILCGLFDANADGGGGVGVGVVACLMGLVLLNDDRDEWRGFTSGGIDEDTCRTGGLGGGEESGDIDESTDFDINRLRGDSLANGGVCWILAVIEDLFFREENKKKYIKNHENNGTK